MKIGIDVDESAQPRGAMLFAFNWPGAVRDGDARPAISVTTANGYVHQPGLPPNVVSNRKCPEFKAKREFVAAPAAPGGGREIFPTAGVFSKFAGLLADARREELGGLRQFARMRGRASSKSA